jgi:hypothetical protein
MTKHINHNIFLIYSTHDKFVNKESLEKMCKELELHGDVFVDLLHNNALDKQEYVLQKLFDATCIVIVNSPEIKESKWAQLEIKLAKEQNKRILGYFEPSYFENECEFKLITNSKKSS